MAQIQSEPFSIQVREPSALSVELPTWDDEDAAYAMRGYIDNAEAAYLDDGRWSAPRLAIFANPNSWSGSTIHGTTEGDDLWVAVHMVKRLQASGLPATTWLARRDALVDYFIDDFLSNIQNSSEENGPGSYCHYYGWGLCDWLRDNPSHPRAADALQAIDNMVAEAVDWNYNSSWAAAPGEAAINSGGRKWARNLRFAIAAAEVSPTASNIAHRDRILDVVVQDPNWDSTYNNYFARYYTNVVGGDYDAGDRLSNTWHMSLLADALWQAFRVTEPGAKRSTIRQRLIDLATFYRDMPFQNGAFNLDMGFNINSGQRLYFRGADSVYTSPPINPLVFAYKLTGDSSYLDKAWQCLEGFFANVPTGWGATGDPAPNKIATYCDACISSGDGFKFLAFNKGQLQYIYALFENGGQPGLVGPV